MTQCQERAGGGRQYGAWFCFQESLQKIAPCSVQCIVFDCTQLVKSLVKKKRFISVKAIHALDLLQEVCFITSETLCKASFLNCATSIYRNHTGLRRLKGHVTYPSVGKANPFPAHVSTNEKPVPLHHVFAGAKLGRGTGIWSRPAPNCDCIIYLGKLELLEERPL